MANDKTPTKRTTLSLKTGTEIKPTGPRAEKKFQVEIKKKRSGLKVDIGKSQRFSSKYGNGTNRENNAKLTDQEFRVRVKVLQEAMKQEENREAELQKNVVIEPKTEPILQNTSTTAPTSNTQQQEVPAQNQDQTAIAQNKPEVKTRQNAVKNTYKPEKPVVFRAEGFAKKTPLSKPTIRPDGNKNIKPDARRPIKQAQKRPFNLSAPQDSTNDKTRYTKPSDYNTQAFAPMPDAPDQKHRMRYNDNNQSDQKKKKDQTRVKISEKRSFSSSGKFTKTALARAMNDDGDQRTRSLAAVKRARMKLKNNDKTQTATTHVVREVQIPDMITVGELANRMAVKASEVLKYLMSVGTMATINQSIDSETAEIVCTAFGHTIKRISESDIENELDFSDLDSDENLVKRPPIVAVMGHVDHGKTTLLDTLRKTAIAQKEAGGITQHVAAYQIATPSGAKITFIDTPGHAAFASIRARGATLTDIIVLVVAADDGIKEQTIEVIKQAKSQNVPLIVAINKIDKPDIDINRVKTTLMNYEVLLEDFGGETLSVEISAKHNINLDKLLETILLQSEMLDLKANPDRGANGIVLESKVEKGRGIVASVIVQAGSLKNGDIFVAGATSGKIRAIFNASGKKISAAGPSEPVEITGFDEAPEPGDSISVLSSEQKAREIAEYRQSIKNRSKLKSAMPKSLSQMMSEDKEVKTLNLFIKADVYGSIEAIEATLLTLNHPEVQIKIISKDIGVISESDIDFAKTSEAIVIGFNISTTALAKDKAKLNNIKILNHSVIYHLVEEIKDIMSSMLSPIIEEQYSGTAEIKKIFTISRLGTVAGCYVTDGIIKRNNSKIKVIRNGECVFEGKIKSMKHEKDEIKESKQSHECGILAEGFNDFIEGDKIECYEIITKKRSI